MTDNDRERRRAARDILKAHLTESHGTSASPGPHASLDVLQAWHKNQHGRFKAADHYHGSREGNETGGDVVQRGMKIKNEEKVSSGFYWQNLFRARIWWTSFWAVFVAGIPFGLASPPLFWVGFVIGGGFALLIQVNVPLSEVAMTRCPTCDRWVGAGKKTCRLGHPAGTAAKTKDEKDE